jgi:hypothetical protein
VPLGVVPVQTSRAGTTFSSNGSEACVGLFILFIVVNFYQYPMARLAGFSVNQQFHRETCCKLRREVRNPEEARKVLVEMVAKALEG